MAGRAWAAAPADSQSSDLSISPAMYADDTTPAPPAKPLTALMDKVGLGPSLEAANITIGGYAEGSWTYNFDTPGSHVNTGRVFDFEDQDLTLNQLDLFVDRAVDATKGKFDIGFHVEAIYGADSRLIHSNGLDFYGPGDASNGGQEFPQNQLDLNQAYITMAIPVGSGLTLQIGKFVTPIGYETINPTTNPFYSHSYEFGYAIPFTQTGILAKYNITKELAITGGITRGWEQSSKDSNNAIDFLGSVAYAVNDKLTATLNISCGPQQVDNTGNYRTLLDLIVAYKMSDNLSLAVDADYGYEAHGAADGTTGQWSGIAFYAGYTIDPRVTLNGRLEYFNDDDGARGLGNEVYEATVGATIKPFPDNQWASGFEVRPEVRWDYCNHSIFDAGDNDNQVTFGIDGIYAF
jgi:hypothetical protein